MNDHEFQQRLSGLLEQMRDLPEPERARLELLANQTRERHEKMKQTVAALQESLDYLRLSIKYLVFDLEATRRENQYLRKLLDSRPSAEGSD